MNEMFLLKLGEIVLKGGNRFQFENRLKTNVRRRMRPFGEFRVYIVQSTVYIEPEDEGCDLDGAWEACHYIFGVVSLCRCRPCEKELDGIFRAAMEYLGDDLRCAGTFKVESKRSDKRFPLTSIAISQEIGGRIAEAIPTLQVDVHHPEYTVFVEVRDHAAYVHGPAEPGAGGLPTGVGGRAMVLLSGGIDSPVAGYMIAKRGVELECVHFFSYPYTSELAKDKVLELARLMTRYCGKMTVNVVGFTEIQEAIRDNCPEEFFTLIMRRFMMMISERIARDHGCGCLVTGENLGQVASQTMEAMAVTGACGAAHFSAAYRHGQGGDRHHCTQNRHDGNVDSSLRGLLHGLYAASPQDQADQGAGRSRVPHAGFRGSDCPCAGKHRNGAGALS